MKTERPSFWDAVARAKWDAYAKNCGLSAQEAKVKYIDLLVHVLRRGASLSSSTSSSVNILIDDLVGGTTSSKDKFNPSSTDVSINE